MKLCASLVLLSCVFLGLTALADETDREARIEELKAQVAQRPRDSQPRLLLAKAYLEDDNEAWALRTLHALAELDSQGCEPVLWTAWIHLNMGAFETARETLQEAACPVASPDETRRLLLLAMIEHRAARRASARDYFRRARSAKWMYAEDRQALKQLAVELEPGYLPPISGIVDLGLGFTSNVRAGAPTDPQNSGEDESSAMGQAAVWLRFVGTTGRWVRPSLEVQSRATGLANQSGRDFSYASLGARPGLVLGDAPGGGALLAYRFEALSLAGGDRYDSGPVWLYEAHRAELEATMAPGLTLLGGLGQRRFREMGRGRVEVDGGVGGSRSMSSRVGLLGALTGRFHGAANPAYDLWGGSGLFGFDMGLCRGWGLRGSGLVSLDIYPRSAGYFDASQPRLERREVLFKLSLGVKTPAWKGLSAQLGYELADRVSTVAAYEYVDHRALLRLSYAFSVDPRAPFSSSPQGHVPLELVAVESGSNQQLSELLRQEEAASRSSSCVE